MSALSFGLSSKLTPDSSSKKTGTPTTFVWNSTLFSSTAATNTMPTITAELQSLGNGNSLPTNSISNFIILSWPTTFTQETIAVTPINGVVPV